MFKHIYYKQIQLERVISIAFQTLQGSQVSAGVLASIRQEALLRQLPCFPVKFTGVQSGQILMAFFHSVLGRITKTAAQSGTSGFEQERA